MKGSAVTPSPFEGEGWGGVIRLWGLAPSHIHKPHNLRFII